MNYLKIPYLLCKSIAVIAVPKMTPNTKLPAPTPAVTAMLVLVWGQFVEQSATKYSSLVSLIIIKTVNAYNVRNYSW